MEQESVKFSAEKWYVRTGDGATYGPATPLELVGWAAEARIVPGCQISQDGVTWVPAETISRLRMEWMVEIAPDEKIGPLHLLAIGDLVREGTIPLGAVLVCAPRQVRTTIDHHFFALLLQEARENLGGAAEEENRLLRQIQEQVIPSIRADCEAQWKPVERAWLAEQEQWQATEKIWQARQTQAQTELEAARTELRRRQEEFAAVQVQLEERLQIAEGEFRQTSLQLEQERQEFTQVRQGLIAELDETKTRLAQLGVAQEEAQRNLDQFRATQGVERQKIADLERRYQDETTTLQKARDEALQSRELLRASLESADQERAALRNELEALRSREAPLRVELSEYKAAVEAQMRLAEQARAETQAQTRMADELRMQLAQQTESSTRLAQELVQYQHTPVDLTSGPTDSVLLDESELLEQECAHLAELLDQLPPIGPTVPVVTTPVSAIDWIDPRPTPPPPVAPPLSATTPVALRIQGAVKVLRQAEKELAKQRQLYHDLIRRGADREAELTALVEQLKRDLEMSSRLVSQSMEEMEKREGELRQFRRGEGAIEPPAQASRVSASPLEPEVLPPVSMDTPPKKLARDVPLRAPKTVLAGLEQQARADLQNWQKQRAKAEPGAMGRLKKWISRDR